jgi:hypothetical protein
MSLKRNLVLFAAYLGTLVFMAVPFAMLDAKGPPATFAEIARTAR